ncbi:MAG: BrnT family toxin, partial [Nitrospinota bacterium]
MRIKDFIWLDVIEDKCLRKHNVNSKEVEEIFFNKPKFKFIEKGNYPDEDVYSALGKTNGGRYLIIFFILKASGGAL